MEWISCRDKMPPWGKWVYVKEYSEEFIAKRVGFFFYRWKFRSGITAPLWDFHKYKEIEEKG